MTNQSSIAGIILAAGKGTRMKSDLPKCLHSICGLPMAEWVGRAMQEAGVTRPIVVIGHGGEQLQKALGEAYDYAWQREQKGTGHAALMASPLLDGQAGPVVLASGDTPLLDAEALQTLLARHRKSKAACTVATVNLADPSGYGRIVRDSKGTIQRIVEEKDASAEEKAITEVNAAVYVFENQELVRLLPSLKNSNAQGEYYLTDAVEAMAKHAKVVEAVEFEDRGLLKGVNDRWQLAEADLEMRRRLLKKLALDGVTLLDPATTYVDGDVQVGKDTVIEAGTHLRGDTQIGESCHIGPNSFIQNCRIGDGCRVRMSHLVQANVGNGVKIGPYANVRPGTVLAEGVKIGNFVEIKNAVLGERVAASHLAYIGDASIGAGSNIGAGTITCNYDGFEKHRTEIGEGVFVGSNSTLVAPIEIGDGAFIAAGSVISNDVPPEALALGRARQENKEGWVAQWRKRKS